MISIKNANLKIIFFIITIVIVQLNISGSVFSQTRPAKDTENKADPASGASSEKTEKQIDDKTTEFSPSVVDIYGFLNVGYMINGKLKDIQDDSLRPEPNLYQSGEIGAALSFYLSPSIGLDGSYSYGFVSAVPPTSTGTNSFNNNLNLYEYNSINLGLQYRHFVIHDSFGDAAIIVGTGIAHTAFDFHQDYKDLLDEAAKKDNVILVYPNDRPTGLGYYIKAGMNLYAREFYWLGIDLRYVLRNVDFPNTSTASDFGQFMFSIQGGIKF